MCVCVCVQVNATELDGSGLQYTIIFGDFSNRFRVNIGTGVVTTREVLDREEQDRYILTIQARDMGPVLLSAFTQVRGRLILCH